MNQMFPGRDEQAWTELSKAWRLPNLGKATFYWESSHCPVNESPFGLAAGLQYMVLRSDTGNINVFPQRVEALRNVSFAAMRAEGGFVVSGVLSELKTKWVSIESLLGNECLLRVRDFDDVEVDPPSIPVEKRGWMESSFLSHVENTCFGSDCRRAIVSSCTLGDPLPPL